MMGRVEDMALSSLSLKPLQKLPLRISMAQLMEANICMSLLCLFSSICAFKLSEIISLYYYIIFILKVIFFLYRYVGKFVKKSDRAVPSHEVKYTNLYVKNLDTGISEEVLKEKFSQYGQIVSLVISRDETGASRGFGFVNFDKPEDAKSAVEALHESQLGM